jgi:hypothetical protein
MEDSRLTDGSEVVSLALAALYPQEDSWNSFMSEAESNLGTQCSQLKNAMTSTRIEPVILNNMKNSTVAKDLKFDLYVHKFTGGSNQNRVPSNRSILKFISDQSKMQHQQSVYSVKGKCDCTNKP